MASLLEKMRSAMTSLAAPLRQVGAKTRWNVLSTRWDQGAWKQVRAMRPVDKLITDLDIGDEHLGGTRPGFDAAPEFVRDVWMCLYKTGASLVPPAQVARDVYPARKLVEQLLGFEDLRKLQETTGGDAAMATMALVSMSGQLRQMVAALPKPPPPPPSPGEQPDDPQDQTGGGSGSDGSQPGGEPQAGEQPADGSGDSGGSEGGQDDQDDRDDQDPSEAELAAQAAEADWQAAYDALAAEANLDTLTYRALEAAREEVDDLDKTIAGIGLDAGEWKTMDPVARIALAEKLKTPQMQLLAKAIGRMRRFAMGQRATRVVNVPHTVFDVTTGRDLRHLLPSQYALLATPATRLEFYRRWAGGELLQYKLHGTEEVGHGPMVVCVDKSGSMDGEPFTWAVAVAEALRRLAAEQHRDVFVMFFGTNDDRERFAFPGGQAPIEKVLAYLSCEANGGTEFDGVLDEAMRRVSTSFDGQGKDKADIVFVTDGQARLGRAWLDAFNAERARTGVRVYSVFVSGAYDMNRASAPLEVLRSFSDEVIHVQDLQPQAVGAVFAKV